MERMENFGESQTLDSIKKNIRSVLLPQKYGLKLRYFEREYEELNGSKIPYNHFGFHCLFDFLQEIRDCVGIRVQDNHTTEGDYILFGISDKSTQHIQKFVDEQKDDTNRIILNPNSDFETRRVFNRINTFKPYSLDLKQSELNSQLKNMRIGFNQTKVQRNPVCPLPYNRVIPVEERLKIRQLMDAFTDGINLINFLGLYKRFHKEPLVYQRFGFETLEEFLRDSDDFVKLVVIENGIKAIPVNSGKGSSIQSEQLLNDSANGITKLGPKKAISLADSVIPQKELEYLRTILSMHPNGLPVHQFATEYQKLAKVPLIVGKWGFGSPIEMFIRLSDVFDLQKPQNKRKDMDEWTVHQSTDESRAALCQSKTPKPKIDYKLKQQLLNIFDKIFFTKPNTRLYIDDFRDAYELLYNQTFELPEGYRSLTEFFTEFSKVSDIDIKEYEKDNPFIVRKNKTTATKS